MFPLAQTFLYWCLLWMSLTADLLCILVHAAGALSLFIGMKVCVVFTRVYQLTSFMSLRTYVLSSLFMKNLPLHQSLKTSLLKMMFYDINIVLDQILMSRFVKLYDFSTECLVAISIYFNFCCAMMYIFYFNKGLVMFSIYCVVLMNC